MKPYLIGALVGVAVGFARPTVANALLDVRVNAANVLDLAAALATIRFAGSATKGLIGQIAGTIAYEMFLAKR